MFPEPKEFVKVNKFVVKDSKGYYNRYWNFDKNKWVGLLEATMMTKEDANAKSLPENGVVVNYDTLLK